MNAATRSSSSGTHVHCLDAPVDSLEVAAYNIPTDQPESDGTLEWNSTILVLVRLRAAETVGLGFTYASESTAVLIKEKLESAVVGHDAFAINASWHRMIGALRNLGRPGISSMAIAAVDIALWDLKAKLLQLPLVSLLGQLRPGIPAYGSGGFTSYSIDRLQQQLAGWSRSGLRAVKMKIGREPAKDPARIKAAREAISPETELYVDANGAYSRKQAIAQAEVFSKYNVTWFEEPVVSDDLAGLRLIRDHAPVPMAVAAGEYGYDISYFRRMLESGAVDVLQADATRCAGITGFIKAAALCDAFQTPLSAHTAPSIHQHPCCALQRAMNVEYFHDHSRIEQMFFEGAAKPVHGLLEPDLSRPGLGLDLKQTEVERYAI